MRGFYVQSKTSTGRILVVCKQEAGQVVIHNTETNEQKVVEVAIPASATHHLSSSL
jgi:hypothetical protein